MLQFIYLDEKLIAIIDSQYIPHRNDELEIDDTTYCIDEIKYKTIKDEDVIKTHGIAGADIKVSRANRRY